MPKVKKQDKISQVQDSMSLKHYFDNLPYAKSVMIKHQMAHILGVTVRTIDGWQTGRIPIRHGNKLLINQAAGQKVFSI